MNATFPLFSALQTPEAAQVLPRDKVLEPSAGTGLMAIIGPASRHG